MLQRIASWMGYEKRAVVNSTGPNADLAFPTLTSIVEGNISVPSASQTAAVQFAVGLISDAFAVGRVTPETPATEAITPEMLAMIARQMLLTGNSLHEIRLPRGGGIGYLPVPSFSVTGGIFPENWAYECTWFDQDGNELKRRVVGDSVIHVRHGNAAYKPWLGVSPLVAAGMDSLLLARIVEKLGMDANAPVAYVVPMPDGASVTQRQGVAAEVRDARGRATFPETTRQGYGQGQGAAPQHDWEQKRIGPEPPQSAINLLDTAGMSVMAALGVSPALYRGDGGALREAFRQMFVARFVPIARLIEAELRVKLELPDLEISLEDLQAIDGNGRARTVSSLTQAGVPLGEALHLVGWNNVDLTESEEEFNFRMRYHRLLQEERELRETRG